MSDILTKTSRGNTLHFSLDNMRVLTIGTDAHVFDATSPAGKRQRAYAEELGHLDVVVLTKYPHLAVQDEHFSAYPAFSHWRIVRAVRAYFLARTRAKPEAVSVQDPFEVGLIGFLAAWHFGVPLHVQVHTDFLSSEFSRLSPVNRVRVRIAGFVLRRASRIRVVSERIKESIENTYELRAPLSVLPIFVDAKRYSGIPRLKHPRFKISLLVISRLEPEKDVSLAVRALHQLRTAGHDAGLTIAGEGSQHGMLVALSRSLGLERFVEFVGWRDPATALQTADILLVPSRYEGYGMAIVESLAAGVPVLATDVGVAREAGAIVTSPQRFAETLLQWVSSGPRTAELKGYPYRDFDEYVRDYCADIEACRNAK